MIRIESILDALAAKLAGAFAYPVYVDDVPKDFKRPSFLVEITGLTAKDHTRWTEELTLTARITAFAEVDAYGCAPQAEVLKLQRETRALFVPGLAVGDRILHIRPATSTPGLTDGVITLSITYVDDRDTRPTFEKMGAIETKIKTEEKTE